MSKSKTELISILESRTSRSLYLVFLKQFTLLLQQSLLTLLQLQRPSLELIDIGLNLQQPNEWKENKVLNNASFEVLDNSLATVVGNQVIFLEATLILPRMCWRKNITQAT